MQNITEIMELLKSCLNLEDQKFIEGTEDNLLNAISKLNYLQKKLNLDEKIELYGKAIEMGLSLKPIPKNDPNDFIPESN